MISEKYIDFLKTLTYKNDIKCHDWRRRVKFENQKTILSTVNKKKSTTNTKKFFKIGNDFSKIINKKSKLIESIPSMRNSSITPIVTIIEIMTFTQKVTPFWPDENVAFISGHSLYIPLKKMSIFRKFLYKLLNLLSKMFSVNHRYYID